MSRYNRYIRALATGYGLLAFNIAYSLAVVPLALTHLGKETFGLWALTIQIGAIAHLADAGMTGALNRIIVDYKDDKASAGYRQIFYTIWLVFSVIGLGLALVIWGGAPTLISLLAIPEEFRTFYADFLAVYGLFLGFNFVVKPFSVLPFAHQRSDLLNLVAIGGLIIGFLTIWHGLNREWGLWSLMAGIVASQLLTFPAILIICFNLRLFPRATHHRKLSIRAFREVFDYGKDRMLITLGFTALQTLPTILITRILGLEAGAVWNVASRAAQLCNLMIDKVVTLTYPVLAEMYVRGEHERMRHRHTHLMLISLGLACLAAVGIATCNRDFVSLWTGGRIGSFPLLDGIFALWLITMVCQKLFFMPASIARNLKKIRFYYLIEAALVATLGVILLGVLGQIWVMAAVLTLASLLVTIPTNFLMARRVLRCGSHHMLRPVWSIGIRVVVPALISIAGAIIFAPAGQWPVLAMKLVIVVAPIAGILLSHSDLRMIITEASGRIFPNAFRRRPA